MSLLLSRLELNRAGEEARAGVTRDLRGEIARLDRLVSDILDYARPLNLQLKTMSLRTLLDGTLELYRGVFEGKRIQNTVAVEGDLKVRVDADRLKQCLVNLLQNAVEAVAPGGRIDITAGRDGESAVIYVRDDGVGLPSQPEGRLFDLFFTTKEHGTGLGLSTVKKIMEAHGGSISIGARTDGAPRGAEVRLTLPLNSQI